jgi:hypothetical protein
VSSDHFHSISPGYYYYYYYLTNSSSERKLYLHGLIPVPVTVLPVSTEINFLWDFHWDWCLGWRLSTSMSRAGSALPAGRDATG